LPSRRTMLNSSFHILERALSQHRIIKQNLKRDEPRTVSLSLLHARMCLERVTGMLAEAKQMKVSVAQLSRDFGTLDARVRPMQRDMHVVAAGVRDIRHERDVEDFKDDIMHILETFGDHMVRDTYCVGLQGLSRPRKPRKHITLEMRRQAAKTDPREVNKGLYKDTLQNNPHSMLIV
jgi:hypothetical protein